MKCRLISVKGGKCEFAAAQRKISESFEAVLGMTRLFSTALFEMKFRPFLAVSQWSH